MWELEAGQIAENGAEPTKALSGYLPVFFWTSSGTLCFYIVSCQISLDARNHKETTCDLEHPPRGQLGCWANA